MVKPEPVRIPVISEAVRVSFGILSVTPDETLVIIVPEELSTSEQMRAAADGVATVFPLGTKILVAPYGTKFEKIKTEEAEELSW